MQRMYFKDLETFITEASNINGLYLGKIRQLSLSDFLLEFSHKQNLFISLNNATPFVSKNINKTTYPPGGELHSFIIDARRALGGKLIDIKMVNEDLILALTFARQDNLFKIEHFTLMIELIAHHPNAFVLNSKNEIVSAYRYSYDTTLRGRLLRRNIVYELPKKSETFAQINASNINFYERYLARDYLFIKKQNYRELFIYLELNIKKTKRLLVNLEKDVQKQQEIPLLYEAGNFLLTEKPVIRSNSFIVNDKKVNYEQNISLYENANRLFKKAQKLKRAEVALNTQIAATNERLTYFNTVFTQLLQTNDENEIEEIRRELNIKPKKEMRHKNVKKTVPYTFVYDDITIMFGKNNVQNDTLTFKHARKDDYFFHIKNESGAHVIVRGANDLEKVLAAGASTVLALAGKVDGEVIYTLVKNVTKGRFPGLVHVREYKTIYLRNVDENIRVALKSATRLT